MQASVAGFVVISLALSMGTSATAVAQQSESSQPQASIASQPSENESSSLAAGQNQSSPGDPASQASGAQQSGAQQGGSATPLGTAAAPKEEVTGVMGSRPAGAAIAPAKQRRVRTFLIKVGAVVGAGVAIGTVAALSKGSPSRPQ